MSTDFDSLLCHHGGPGKIIPPKPPMNYGIPEHWKQKLLAIRGQLTHLKNDADRIIGEVNALLRENLNN